MSESKFKIIDWTDKLKNFNERVITIVIHHTASNSVESTMNGFKSSGTSAHYLVSSVCMFPIDIYLDKKDHAKAQISRFRGLHILS